MKKYIYLLIIITSINNVFADRAHVQALPQYAISDINKSIPISCIYQYSIENDSNLDHFYNIEEILKIDNITKKINLNVIVPSHTIISTSHFIDFNFIPNIKKTYPIHASISLNGNTTINSFSDSQLTVN